MATFDPLAFFRDVFTRAGLLKAQPRYCASFAGTKPETGPDNSTVQCPKCGWTGNIETEARQGYHSVYIGHGVHDVEVEGTAFCPECGFDFL